jgi:hypothetical protein
LPAAFLNAFVQRVLRGLYLVIVTRREEQAAKDSRMRTHLRWKSLRHLDRQNRNVCET